MLRILSQSWWMFLVRGIIAILFGLAALFWPALTITTLVVVFGIYAIMEGILAIVTGFSSREDNDQWWVTLLMGLAGIIVGIWAMLFPGLTAIGLLYFIAAWLLITGVLQIIYAIRVRQEISNEWFLILSGVISAILGIVFIFFPGNGALSLIWVIGIYAIIFGVILIVLSFRLRGLKDEFPDRFSTV